MINSFPHFTSSDDITTFLASKESSLLTLLYYARVNPLDRVFLSTVDGIESAAYSVYRLILQCERFYQFWRLDKMDYFQSIRVLDISREYFSTMTKNYLHERLSFLQDCPEDVIDYYLHPTEFFADNLPVHLVSRIDEIAHDRCRRAIKHREINDLNIKYVQPAIFSKEYVESLRVCV